MMRGSLIIAILFIWSQETKGKVTTEVLNGLRYELVDIKHDLQKRSIADIWNSIKNTANHAWEYIKDLTESAKKRLAKWIAKIKVKAENLRQNFEERLNKMKDRINEMIKTLEATGELVKECLMERKHEINTIIKNILFDVTNCIATSLTYLNNSAVLQYGTIPNKTEFLNGIENDLNICLENYKDNDEVEKCIQNIRKGIYENIETTEEYILQNNTEKRGATDDLLNTIVECTTDGIIKSTTIIANETIHIIECVKSKG